LPIRLYAIGTGTDLLLRTVNREDYLMPKKSRRVAARQAELGQRKRRAVKHPSGDELPVPTARVRADAQVEIPREVVPSDTVVPDIPRRVAHASPTSTTTQSTHNPYIWSEIKRIGTITGLILIILAVFTVLLR